VAGSAAAIIQRECENLARRADFEAEKGQFEKNITFLNLALTFCRK